MPLIQASQFSCANSPYAGVIPQPYVSSLGGESYKYASKGGRRGKRYNSKKQQRLTKKAKQNRRSRRTRSNR
jgi:hypothetical protein